jgi:hypothetical protein
MVLLYEGLDKHKDEIVTRAHEEMMKALAAPANFPNAFLPMAEHLPISGRTMRRRPGLSSS